MSWTGKEFTKTYYKVLINLRVRDSMSLLDKLKERKPLVKMLEKKPLVSILEKRPLLSQSSSSQEVVTTPPTPIVFVPPQNLPPPPPERVFEGEGSSSSESCSTCESPRRRVAVS